VVAAYRAVGEATIIDAAAGHKAAAGMGVTPIDAATIADVEAGVAAVTISRVDAGDPGGALAVASGAGGELVPAGCDSIDTMYCSDVGASPGKLLGAAVENARFGCDCPLPAGMCAASSAASEMSPTAAVAPSTKRGAI
jgi:hypothetical protein